MEKYSGLPNAHQDMPVDVKNIYEEAILVFKHSPRAAAALLRLAIETTFPLEDDDIYGIPSHIQKGLDAIRIYRNEGIHPGEIVLNDDQEIVIYMFELINDMVEELISRRKKIQQADAKIPVDKIKSILNRDKKSKPTYEPTC
ncbi:hypothetical protein ACQKGD_27600 [Peribacillus frigoritolerans]|uniref:hypothetical protein n=1 Tax=Peribacillus frigoritolerans TaxID=450367 RepID=UPI003D04B251